MFKKAFGFLSKLMRNRRHSVVILYGDMGLGNWLMLQPILEELKRGLDSKIYVIDFDRKTPFFYVEKLPFIENVVRLPRFSKSKSITRLLQIGYLFFRFRFLAQPVYIFARHSYSLKNLILGVACGAKRSLANVCHDDPRKKYYSAIGFMVRTYQSHDHEYENNYALLSHFDITPKRDGDLFFPKASSYKLPIDVKERPVILVQAISSPNQYWKRWPEEFWISLINQLTGANAVVALIGSASEIDENSAILKACNQGQVVNLAGQMSLSELGFLASIADCTVSADSVLGHIASVFSTPTVSLLGPGGDGRRPLGKNIKVAVAKCECNGENTISLAALRRIEVCQGKCMRLISVEQAFDLIEDALPEQTKFKIQRY